MFINFNKLIIIKYVSIFFYINKLYRLNGQETIVLAYEFSQSLTSCIKKNIFIQ